jgi:hypothetical protein
MVKDTEGVRDPLRGKCFFFGPKTTADEYGERKVNTVVVLHNLPSAKDSTEKSETKDFICSVVSDNPAQWYDDHLFSDPRRHVGGRRKQQKKTKRNTAQMLFSFHLGSY